MSEIRDSCKNLCCAGNDDGMCELDIFSCYGWIAPDGTSPRKKRLHAQALEYKLMGENK